MKHEPIRIEERIVSLDVIRGFALFGIFLVNMPAFVAPALKFDFYGLMPSYTGIDHWIRLLFDLFIQAKFYPMFSFLFGLGFYIFLSRAEKKSDHPTWLFVRRIFVLLLFGLLHLVLLWYGDILHTYALAGIFLLLFYNRKTNTILFWAILLILSYYALLASNLLAPESLVKQAQVWNESIGSQKVEEAVHMYTSVSPGDMLAYRFTNEVKPILENVKYQIPHILGLFLLGLYIGKKGVLSDPATHRRFIKMTWLISGLVSLPFTIWLAAIQLDVIDYGVYQDIMSLLVMTVGGPFLTSFYVFSFVQLLQKEQWRKLLSPIGTTGRMALTNYLMQTIVTLAIVFGFGLYNRIGLFVGLLMTLIIYALQVIFSVYWLKKHRFGPFEWVWRSLTYGKLQPMKKVSKESSEV